MSEWVVRKRADQLKPEEKFIFAEELGGEGEVLTVVGIGDAFGTLSITTEEFDFDVDVSASTMLTMAKPEEEDDDADQGAGAVRSD